MVIRITIKESFLITWEMAKVLWSLPMVVNMMAILKTINSMAKENWFILMEIFIQEILKMV
jgi:hypothetical protein